MQHCFLLTAHYCGGVMTNETYTYVHLRMPQYVQSYSLEGVNRYTACYLARVSLHLQSRRSALASHDHRAKPHAISTQESSTLSLINFQLHCLMASKVLLTGKLSEALVGVTLELLLLPSSAISITKSITGTFYLNFRGFCYLACTDPSRRTGC